MPSSIMTLQVTSRDNSKRMCCHDDDKFLCADHYDVFEKVAGEDRFLSNKCLYD